MEAIYHMEGDLFCAGSNAAGPWNPTMQHGSAPASLFVRGAELAPSKVPMRIARMTIDLLRPVPLEPLHLNTEIVREGSKIQVVAMRLLNGDREVARATALKVRRESEGLEEAAMLKPLDLPLPEEGSPRSDQDDRRSGFSKSVEMRFVKGEFRVPGPSAAWCRLTRPFIEGEEITPAMRGVATGDFCNGMSAALDFEKWTFINGDLSVHLAREPKGEWILLNAQSWYGPDGIGLAFADMADVHGYFGRATQSLVLEKRA